MTLENLLAATGLGVIQLDRRARIVAANDRARRVLQMGDVLFDTGGSLFARTPLANAELQDLLTRALPPYGNLGAGGSMIARRPTGPPPLVLHVVPVDGGVTGPVAWPVAALVLMPDAAEATDADAGTVARTLNFTPAESQVAALLARGMTVRQAAAALGRGESTVRSHIKHMFTKQGLSRQADLVRARTVSGGNRQYWPRHLRQSKPGRGGPTIGVTRFSLTWARFESRKEKPIGAGITQTRELAPPRFTRSRR